MATHERRVVFFDLDGTLHQQDMFGCFLRYLLRRQPQNALLVLPLLPIIVIALLIKGRAARWPMSLLLWGCTFGHSEARIQALQADFVHWFRDNVTVFPLVQERLTSYAFLLHCPDGCALVDGGKKLHALTLIASVVDTNVKPLFSKLGVA